MRQPAGLYLREFARPEPVAAAGAGLPCFDPVGPFEPAPAFDLVDPFTVNLAPDDAVADHDAPEPLVPLPEPAPPEPDLAAVVEAMQADHAAALAEARRSWAAEEGATLAAGLAAAMAELETRIADTLAPLLEPFLVQAAQVTALAGLRDALGTLLDDRDGTVAVAGPADLLAALRHRLPSRAGLIFTEADVPDVTVTLGDTRIRSQLAGWARALETALDLPA